MGEVQGQYRVSKGEVRRELALGDSWGKEKGYLLLKKLMKRMSSFPRMNVSSYLGTMKCLSVHFFVLLLLIP